MIKCSSAHFVQYGMTITQGRCCQQLTEITYIAKHIYYALTDGKTDWSCHKSPKHERRDWLRLIDSIKTFGAFLGAWGGGGGQSDVWFFLACHLLVITWQEAPFLLAIHVAYLTHFRKPVLMLAMAVDGGKGRKVGTRANVALVLVCWGIILWVATGMLPFCHAPLAVMSQRPPSQNFGQLGAVTKTRHVSTV